MEIYRYQTIEKDTGCTTMKNTTSNNLYLTSNNFDFYKARLFEGRFWLLQIKIETEIGISVLLNYSARKRRINVIFTIMRCIALSVRWLNRSFIMLMTDTENWLIF